MADTRATPEAPRGVPSPPPSPSLRAAPWVLSTYFAEGLPFSIVRQLASEFFTSMGTKLSDIGATSLYGLAWNLKFTWSPLLDRYGSLRGWLVGIQALLGLVIMALALPASNADLALVAKILVVAAILAATHDVAIDGFYLEALPPSGQTALAGLRTSAYRLALLAGKGLLALAGALQLRGTSAAAAWRTTFFLAGGALVVLAGVHAFVLPRPVKPHVKAPSEDRPTGGLGYIDAFRSFLAQPKAGVSLAFIVLYKAGDALMFAMSPPFLKSLGLDDLARGVVGTWAKLVSIVAAIGAGAAISRFGLARTLRPIVAIQALAILPYVGLAVLRPGVLAVSAVAIFEYLAAGIGDAALVVFLMRRCQPEHKTAHFALATALMSLAATGAGYVSGHLVEAIGFPLFFGLAFAAALPGVVLGWIVPQD